MHPRTLVSAAASIAAFVAVVPAARAGHFVYCTPTPDQVTVTAAAPAGKGLDRAPYLYVADGVLDVTITSPACAHIPVDGAFVLDGAVLASPVGAIDAPANWAQLTSDLIGADGLQREVVRVGFAHNGQGGPHHLDVIAAGRTYHLQPVDVASVDGAVRYTMATAELASRIMLGIATSFPDGTITKSAVVIREPDWSTFVLDVDASGIRARFHTTASPQVNGSPYWCDVGVDVDAAFAITQDGAGRLHAVTRWTNVSINDTGGCTLAEAASVLVRATFTVITSDVADSAVSDLNKGIDDNVGNASCGLPCIALNLFVTTTADGLELLGDAFGGHDSVTIHVPYGGNGFADPTRWLPLPSGTTIAVIAGGTAGVCADDWHGGSAACSTIAAGPGGLYDAWANFPGIDPAILNWGMTNGLGDLVNWADVAQRSAAVAPMPEENVGALIARQGSSAGTLSRKVGSPCQLPGAGDAAHVGFAINDEPRAGDAYGRGGYDAMIVFLPDASLPIPTCKGERIHLDEPVRGRWAMTGSEFGPLGMPTTAVQVVANGADTTGRFAEFDNGSMYFHPRIGTPHWTIGAIRAKWLSMGGATSWFGYPTTDELDDPNGGKETRFESGTVYIAGALGAHMVQGGIRDRYVANGGPGGALGYPTTDELAAASGGRASHFEHGSIYWTGALGAHAVSGAIRDTWWGAGAEGGWFGFPTTEQAGAGSGWIVQQFEHATVYAHPFYGVVTYHR